MFKELSRPIIFFVMLYICIFSSAEAQPGNSKLEKLEARLGAYKDAFRSKDYVKAASFVSPNKINKIRGEDLKGSTFRLILPIDFNGHISNYKFTFMINDVVE